MLTTNHSRKSKLLYCVWPQSKLQSPCSSCNQNRFKCQSAETARKSYCANPRGIWVLSQVVLPGKLGSWLAQAAQELTNPQVWITAPLPCVFSLRGKRLKIRTDTTLDLCGMECNCCLHCTSENSLQIRKAKKRANGKKFDREEVRFSSRWGWHILGYICWALDISSGRKQ